MIGGRRYVSDLDKRLYNEDDNIYEPKNTGVELYNVSKNDKIAEAFARSQNPSPNELPSEISSKVPVKVAPPQQVIAPQEEPIIGSQGKLLIPERKEKFPAVTETVTT